jgi:glycosyltransferase involved in cell wall biosynthesis
MNKLAAKQKNQILIAIPAYNEEATIGEVVSQVRQHLSEFDLLVVNDGSTDSTASVLQKLDVVTATHLCNLGYGRTIQTILKYAVRCGYSALVTMDADGQHHPEQIRGLIDAFKKSDVHLLIGSRYVNTRRYRNVPLGRKIGMQLFSWIVGILGKQRIYDTSSGLKAIRKDVFELLIKCNFVDFHAEVIIYLMRLGYRLREYPITVSERQAGKSMHTFINHIKYPLKTLLLIIIAVFDAEMKRYEVKK